MKYGYVVFDMDGTLIDTCEAIQQSLRDTIVMLTGKTPAKAEMRATFGTPSDVGLKMLGVRDEDIQRGILLWSENIKKYGDIVSRADCVICADDTAEHKPEPGPLLKYMERTGAKPSEVLYVGDTVYDMQCARGAGVDFALARWGNPDGRVDADYDEPTPLALLEKLR